MGFIVIHILSLVKGICNTLIRSEFMGLCWLIIITALSSCAPSIPGPHLSPLKSESSQKGSAENPDDRKGDNRSLASPVIIFNSPATDTDKAKTANQPEQGWDTPKWIALIISGAAFTVSVLAW